MPRAYAKTTPHLRAMVLARVGAGETLAAVCRDDGMPTERCVRNWAKADAGFAAELASARAAGAGRRPPAGGYPPFDEARAGRVLAALAGGATIPRALKAEGLSWRAFRRWRMTQAAFQAEVARLSEAKAQGRRKAGHGRWRAYDAEVAVAILTRVARGEPLRGVLASEPRFPCLSVVARWRADEADFAEGLRQAMAVSRARRGARRLWSDDLEAEICERLLHGASLRQVAADPAMPCGTTMRNWMAKKPGFRHGVMVACDVRDELAGERMWRMAEAATPETAEAVARDLAAIRARYGRMVRRGP